MQPNVFTIFLGNAKTMTMKAANCDCAVDEISNVTPNTSPLDLTSCTEIDVALPNADGTFAHLLLSQTQVAIVSPAVLGEFTVPITSLVSSLLNVGVFQDLDVTFTIGSKVFTVRYEQAFSVFEMR